MATTTVEKSMTGQEIVDLTKKHTLFEWSAQSKVDPIPVAKAKGIYFWTPEGKRFIDFNSQLMSVNIGHGDERVIQAIYEQAQTLAYANPFMATEPRARLGANWPRSRRRYRHILFHQWRSRGQRERHQDCPLLHWTSEDHGALSFLPWCDRRQHLADGRSPPLGRGAGYSRSRSSVGSIPRN